MTHEHGHGRWSPSRRPRTARSMSCACSMTFEAVGDRTRLTTTLLFDTVRFASSSSPEIGIPRRSPSPAGRPSSRNRLHRIALNADHARARQVRLQELARDNRRLPGDIPCSPRGSLTDEILPTGRSIE
jgi:hypothetical protein